MRTLPKIRSKNQTAEPELIERLILMAIRKAWNGEPWGDVEVLTNVVMLSLAPDRHCMYHYDSGIKTMR